MPYIKQEFRVAVRPTSQSAPVIAGDLNFQITTLLITYIHQHGKSYNTLNEIVGALECAKLELYRRVVAPYEDEKIKVNGDVY